MKKLSAVLLSLAMLAPVAGCRHAHLGDDTGDAYKDALEAQRNSDAEEIDPLDARDAKKVMAKHRGGKGRGKSRSGGTVTSSSSSSSSGGGSLYSGATGPIRLDAK